MDQEERSFIERALGPQRSLDGSLASLWAVEEVLFSVRRAPELAPEVVGLGRYLHALVLRAFQEMGLTVEQEGTVIRATAPIAYSVDIADVTARLLRPMRAFPTFYGQRLLGLPQLGAATAPMWGVATAFLNHTWATTDHDLIGKQRDRMDLGYPWVLKEQRCLVGGPDEEVEALLRKMIWAPLGYPTNDRGQHNRKGLHQVMPRLDPGRRTAAVEALLHHPDDAIALMAGLCGLMIGRTPEDRTEAWWMAEATTFFGVVLPKRRIEAIRELLPRQGIGAGGGDPETIAYLRELEKEPPEDVRPLIDDLIRDDDTAAYRTARGWTHERLKRPDRAMRDYDVAVQLDPDFLLARMNRGVLRSREGDYAGADEDLAHAQRVEPFNRDARNNRLLNALFERAARP